MAFSIAKLGSPDEPVSGATCPAGAGQVPKLGRKLPKERRIFAETFGVQMAVGDMDADGANPATITIGTFVLDLKRQQLLRGGRVIELRPKSFDVLRYLSGNPGRVVSKDEIFQAIWPEVTVSDDSLVQCISEIRQALYDGEQMFIRTMPRRGYMFVAADAPALAKPPTAPAETPPDRSPWPRWLNAKWSATTTPTRFGFALAASVGAVLLMYAVWGRDGGDSATVRSVAVLPFDQMTSESTSAAPLGRELTDLVVVRLSNMGTLKVHPTSAVASRLVQGQSALEIGRHLGVDAVLEGRVYQQHDRMRATAHLIRVMDGETIWSERFDEATSDPFKAQDNIALQLATSIAGRRARIGQNLAAQPDSAFPEAMAAYARGRFLLSRRSGSSVEGAIQSFETAISIDRNFALAYASLAEALNLVGAYGRANPRDAFMRSREMALKALELKPALAPAHVALAFVKAHAEHDWPAARTGYLRAIELAPSNATAWQWLALAHAAEGRQAEALSNARAGLKIDPLSLIISVDVGRHLYYSGAYQAATAQFLKTLELDPGFVRAHHELGKAYGQRGQFDQAISAAKRAVDLSMRSDSALASLAKAQASAGDRASAEAILAELMGRRKQRYVSSYHFAVIYAGLGDNDAAFASLEQAYDERFNWTVFINVEPDFSNLRPDPRFSQLVKKMNLKPASRLDAWKQ